LLKKTNKIEEAIEKFTEKELLLQKDNKCQNRQGGIPE
jgi:hypothetical protein